MSRTGPHEFVCCFIYLFREPGAHEGHVVSVGVRVDRAERVRAHGSEEGEDPA